MGGDGEKRMVERKSGIPVCIVVLLFKLSHRIWASNSCVYSGEFTSGQQQNSHHTYLSAGRKRKKEIMRERKSRRMKEEREGGWETFSLAEGCSTLHFLHTFSAVYTYSARQSGPQRKDWPECVFRSEDRRRERAGRGGEEECRQSRSLWSPPCSSPSTSWLFDSNDRPAESFGFFNPAFRRETETTLMSACRVPIGELESSRWRAVEFRAHGVLTRELWSSEPVEFPLASCSIQSL